MLISDLDEGGIAEETLRRVAELLGARADPLLWLCWPCQIRVRRSSTTSTPRHWLRLAYQHLPAHAGPFFPTFWPLP